MGTYDARKRPVKPVVHTATSTLAESARATDGVSPPVPAPAREPEERSARQENVLSRISIYPPESGAAGGVFQRTASPAISPRSVSPFGFKEWRGSVPTAPDAPGEQQEEAEHEVEAAREQQENRTGLPDALKVGVEALSGIAVDDVRVQYNSPKPAAIEALAYTRGAEIHVGPGQEKHLPHEAWHVVQQKQGRVKPTLQAKGLPINDDAGLEREADLMGKRAGDIGDHAFRHAFPPALQRLLSESGIVQRAAMTPMPVGLFSGLRGANTHSVQINAEITKYNAIEARYGTQKSAAVDEAREGLLAKIEGIINGRPRAEWATKFVALNKLESEIVRERATIARNRAAAPEVKERAAAPVAAGPLGASAVEDLSPSRWVAGADAKEDRFASAPDIAGLIGHGEGKKGAQGTTFNFVTPGGRELIGKVDRSNVAGEVKREYDNYRRVYERAGTHRNLATVHGWADLRLGRQHAQGMLMDKIPGMDGRRGQLELRAAWDDGIITSAEYWGAIQYIGRRLLEVVEHLKKAGLVHNDIKPENYMIDERTGEVIVIDLGGASEIGTLAGAVTDEYTAPEMRNAEGKAIEERAIGTEKTDVYTVGATILHAVEAPDVFHKIARPNQGLNTLEANEALDEKTHQPRQPNTAFTRGPAGATKRPFQAGAATAYTSFIGNTMDRSVERRADASDAMGGPTSFLRDSILDDNGALLVLKGVISGAKRKAWIERWDRAISEGKISARERPQTKNRTYKIEMDTQVVKMKKEIERVDSYTDYDSLSAVQELIRRLKEAIAVANRADMVQTNTTPLKRAISRFNLKAQQKHRGHVENLDVPREIAPVAAAAEVKAAAPTSPRS